MTVYLTADIAVAINAKHCGGALRDAEILDGALARPASGHAYGEYFPSIWQKAAVYLHGVSSTQCFFDGNKRTAWLCAVTFLRLNGVQVGFVEDIDAEALVRAVAANLFSTDTEPDRTVECAAHWVELKCTGMNQLRPDPRVEYAFLATKAEMELGGSAFSASDAGLGAVIVSGFPRLMQLQMVLRVHWRPEDAELHTRSMEVVIYETDTGEVTYEDDFTIDGVVPPSTLWHHPNKVQPAVYVLLMAPVFVREADHTLDLSIMGQHAVTLPLDVRVRPDVPDDMAYAGIAEPR